MTRIVGALLARNEAGPDRYLSRVIRDAQRWATHIVVLDDNSTDDTRQLATDLGCIVRGRNTEASPMWGAEASARAELWQLAHEVAGDGWVVVTDADMILVGDPRPLAASWDAAAWAWPLVDLWDSEETYRVDGPWGFGPQTPRPWMFRPSALRDVAQWPARGLHTGHAPLDFPGPIGVAPDLHWLHLSYLRADHRRAKHAQYMQYAAYLTPFERAHAESIIDG